VSTFSGEDQAGRIDHLERPVQGVVDGGGRLAQGIGGDPGLARGRIGRQPRLPAGGHPRAVEASGAVLPRPDAACAGAALETPRPLARRGDSPWGSGLVDNRKRHQPRGWHGAAGWAMDRWPALGVGVRVCRGQGEYVRCRRNLPLISLRRFRAEAHQAWAAATAAA
jgi:hypothetical protein